MTASLPGVVPPERVALLWQVVAFRVRRKCPLRHIVAIAFNGGAKERSRVAVLAHELGRLGEAQVDEVVEDENLSVAVGSGADTDGRDGELGGDALGDLARHAFEHDRGRSRHAPARRESRSEFVDGAQSLSLHRIAAHAMYRLRREPDMADHRNLGVDQPLDQLQAAAATLDLDCFSATLFDEADGVRHALGNPEW